MNPSRETKFSDHDQDWQPYPADPYSAIICNDHIHLHKPHVDASCHSKYGPQKQENYTIQYIAPDDGKKSMHNRPGISILMHDYVLSTNF